MGVAMMQERMERQGRRRVGSGNIVSIQKYTGQSNAAIQHVNSVTYLYILMCSLYSFLPAFDHKLAPPSIGSDGRCVVCHVSWKSPPDTARPF